LLIGGYHNTSDAGDPYRNPEGRPRITAGGSALVHDGKEGRYVIGDAVTAHMGGNAKRPVTVFGGVIASTNGYLPFKEEAIAGVIVTVLLPLGPRTPWVSSAATFVSGCGRSTFFRPRVCGRAEPIGYLMEKVCSR